MKQSGFFKSVFCMFILVISFSVYPDSKNTHKSAVDLSVNKILKRIEDYSSQYKLSQLEVKVIKNNIDHLNGNYDTFINTQFGYRLDASDPVNAVFGTRNDTLTYISSIQKNFKYGTAIEFGFSGSSQSSNSPFVALDPAIDNRWYARFRQSLWSNGFGQNLIKEIQSIEYQVEGSELMAQRRKEILLASVMLHKVQLEYTQNEQYIVDQAYQRALELHQSIINKKRLGVANATDVLASQANLLAREQNVKLADLNYETTCSDILSILEYDVTIYTCSKEEAFVNKFHEALKTPKNIKRLDYKKIESELLANQLLIDAKKNNLNPDLNLILELASNDVDDEWIRSFSESLKLKNPNFFAGVEINIPLQNRQNRSQLKRVQLANEQLKLQMKDLKNNIEKEYYQAQSRYVNYQDQLTISKHKVDVEKEKLKQKNIDFNVGRADISDVILYQQDVLNAELMVKRNQTQVSLALINKSLAQGNLFNSINSLKTKEF